MFNERARNGAAMYGVIIEVRVDPNREDEARRMVREVIVHKAKGHTGFAAGWWLRALESDALRSVHLYENEEQARAAADRIRSEGPPPGAPVALHAVDVYELLVKV
jgi:hypothetical protein